MGKNVPFEWTADCDLAFNRLKWVLSTADVVALLDFSVPIKVYTDASKESVGAVLAQVREDLSMLWSLAVRPSIPHRSAGPPLIESSGLCCGL